MRFAFLLAFAFLPGLCPAQTAPAGNAKTSSVNTALQTSVDRLAQSNRDLLDLLKKQQAVLEDIQFDRRLQSRQIESLEDRLQETLLENAQLQNKIDKLSAAAAAAPAVAPPTPAPSPAPGTANSVQPIPDSSPPADDKPPASYLPAAPPEVDVPSGTLSWHRLFILSGTENKSTDLFHVQGRTWRVLWHNQDKPGKAYANTSALFVNAFPRDDTIPQKVCAKLGSGGDSTELMGPGNYYLKIEASGGAWEVAVEDFH